jgi:hypothetical protein
MDFQWPKDKVWVGYLNPHRSQKCPACEGSGYNPETDRIANNFYNYSSETGKGWCDQITQDEVDALIAENRLYDFTHDCIRETGWQPKDPMPVVTAEEVNRWQQNRRGIGYDGINRMILIKTRATRLGVYGMCPLCNGEGAVWDSPETRKLNEEWKETEPPTGEGYQIWETCSEGSPITPVFASLDELCQWAETNAHTFAHFKATKEEWKRMLEEDCVIAQEGDNIFL